eukprot:TRINITY_DN18726_c0_g1_i1.p1 TRINITY_DN18726_c0_g1~~TRINITY_DN18726_c0_g1_i1.p1  ORF type:complete len:1158 (-),score=142.61 TRINITY_DN18726_c0_g1_i1:196-3669(-)
MNCTYFWRFCLVPIPLGMLFLCFFISAQLANLNFKHGPPLASPVPVPAHTQCYFQPAVLTTPQRAKHVPRHYTRADPFTALRERPADYKPRYTRAELLAVNNPAAFPSKETLARLRQLHIGFCLPKKRGCRGGGRKKHGRPIPVSQVLRSSHTPQRVLGEERHDHGPFPPSIVSDVTPMPPRPQGCNLSNLVVIPLQDSATLPKQLCMCVFNAQSVGKSSKRSSITDFIRDHDVDAMLLTETWLRQSGDEAKCSDLTPPGYTLLSFPRHCNSKIKRGGGLAFIIKDSLADHCSTTTDFPFPHVTFELAQLTLTIHQQRVSFFLVYRPPPSKKNELLTSCFFEELPDFLEFCVDNQRSIVIAGDFNFHFDNAMNVNTRKLCDQLDMFSITQTVSEPTHISNHILDLVMHKNFDNLIHSTRTVHDLASDHYSILCHLAIQKPKRPAKFVSTRSVSKIDHNKFSNDIIQFVTPNMCISELNNTLITIFDKHAPVHQFKVRDKSTPWYNVVADQLSELKRERRRAERRWVSSPSTVSAQIYDTAKEKVTNLVDNAKSSFYSSLVSSSTNCKQLFHNMSSLLGKTKKVSLPTVSDINVLPNMFADFFRNKILMIRNSFPSVSQSVTSNSVSFSGTPLVEFTPVSEDFVRKTILRTAPKSCELDPLPTKLLCNHLDHLLPSITNIMNKSLTTGIVPPEFKTAIVRPLLKKATLDPNNLKNYRPISNLSFLSKLLERIILHQLFSHLTTHKLLSVHQSAYRAGHSTETALLRILNNILVSLDQDKISTLLLLDLSAAFDTIDHEILFSRLEHDFGIKNTALNWFRSYLSERKQTVLVNGQKSSESPLDFGVPQGSVLGPVLFILYTTPLTHLIDSHSVHHEIYADDTQLNHCSSPSNYNCLVQSLQDCVSEVKLWMSDNRLKLNDDKTEAIRFSPTSASSCSLPSTIALGNTTISFSDCVRDLGFFFDQDLSMNQQVIKTCQAAYIELRRISSIRQYLTTEATKTLVSACILSRLDYCNSLLAGYPQKLLRPLQQVQNSAAKLIFKARKSQHCTPLLRELHWLPIEQRIKYKTSCLCFHIISGTAPQYLSDLVNIYVPSRSLRSSSDDRIFRVPKFNREKHGGRAFSSSAIQTWNSLPFSVRHSPSLSSFKTNLKTHLFKQSYE